MPTPLEGPDSLRHFATTPPSYSAASTKEMVKKEHIICITFSLLSFISSFSQSPVPVPTFLPPMDIPIELSGNFMELRSDHFHSGLDMKTQGREGLPVKAAGEGWVSRVKISPWGYGKAVYVDHPNGYTTVYGHLRGLAGAIAEAALAAQYKAKSFDIDVTFEKGRLPVAAGQVIAYSGNTGGSSAPHLHFEVRRTGDQHALDPEAYGMDVPDKVPPTLYGIRIDPLDSTTRTSPYPVGAKGFPVVAKNDSTYTLKDGLNPAAFGTVGLSVNVIDRYSNSPNRCGIRLLEVSVDGTPVFSAHLDEVDFALQRYADAYMDYRLFKANDMNYNRCYKLPNNKLAVYGREPVQGRIAVVPGRDHAVQVRATDANGNRSTLTFVLHGATAAEALAWPVAKRTGELFRYDRPNTIKRDDLRFDLPPNALYADEPVAYTRTAGTKRTLGPVHHLHDALVPLHVAAELRVRIPEPLPQELASKALIVRLDDKGRSTAVGGSTYADRWVAANVRSFGDYTVMLDTLPPSITNLDLKPAMAGRAGFRLRVGDDLSGVDHWTGTLDGAWILLEYEPKSHTLTHTFDSRTSGPGKHTFALEVVDERGNTRTFKQEFTR